MLTLYLEAQLFNLLGHLTDLFVLRLCFHIKSLFLCEIFRLESLVVLSLSLKLLKLSLTSGGFLKFARRCMFLLFSLNF